MRNKTLGRILKKGLSLQSRAELLSLLERLETQISQAQNVDEVRNFFQDLVDVFDSIDKSFSDLDRVLFLRDSSLAISSKEMLALNQEIQEQASRQAAILKRLKETVQLLSGSVSDLSEQPAADHSEAREMEKLVEMVDFLVRTKVDAAKLQQDLYEEGLRICSVLSFRNLELQLKSSIRNLAGPEIHMEIYFSGSLFENQDPIEFYQCDANNDPILERALTLAQPIESTQFLNIESPKGNGTLAILKLSASASLAKEEMNLQLSRISPLVPSIGSTLENIKLLKEEKRKQYIESELDTIRLVQHTLLPAAKPVIRAGDLEVSGYYQSATECSGDWWTYFQLQNGQHVILVGDVTGHGTGSAMVCAVVKGYCDSFVGRSELSVAELLGELNTLVCRLAKESDRVMTMAALMVDTKTGKATFANAGHPLPIVVRGQGSETVSQALRSSGAILGIDEEAIYKELTFDFQFGDRIVLYSDGLTECANTQEEMYGESRLRRLLKESDSRMSASELNRAIIQNVKNFSLGEKFQDDLTTVVVRNLANPTEILAQPDL